MVGYEELITEQEEVGYEELITEQEESMKQPRFELMKQMKDDANTFRKWKRRKRDCEISKLQRENLEQQGILKRTGEESWLSPELDARVRLREAKYHLDRLVSERTEMIACQKHLKERIDEDAPPAKKLLRIQELQEKIDQRNDQITDFQQKIVDADQECKGEAIWCHVNTIDDAKKALTFLLETAVSWKVDKIKSQLEQTKENITLKNENENLKEQITNLQREQEDKEKRIDKRKEKCQCKRQCKNLLCGCRRKGLHCSRNCQCGEACLNKSLNDMGMLQDHHGLPRI